MNNQFVSFEIASKLKDLGFDERCLAIYYQGKLNNGYPVNYINCNMDSFDFRNATNSERNSIDIVTAPLWQQVIDWIWTNYKVLIFPYILPGTNDVIFQTQGKYLLFYETKELAILSTLNAIQNENSSNPSNG